jgi:hypothetical protein
MKLIEINWNPSPRQLRQFGFICLIALPLLGWLWSGGLKVWRWGVDLQAGNLQAVTWLAAIGAALALMGCFCPRGLKPVFLALSLLAAPVGIVLGELAMLILYGAVFAPMAIAFRLMGRDALHRRFDPQAATYWRPKKQPKNVKSYYRQS